MAEKGRLTVEQRVQIVLLFAESKSIVATQGFSCLFSDALGPFSKNHSQVPSTVSTKWFSFGTKTWTCCSVHTAQNIDAVRVAMQRSPGKLTRRASAELTISRCSV
jgi:hypothetical protein